MQKMKDVTAVTTHDLEENEQYQISFHQTLFQCLKKKRHIFFKFTKPLADSYNDS